MSKYNDEYKSQVWKEIQSGASIVKLSQEDLESAIKAKSQARISAAIRSLNAATFELIRLYGELQGIEQSS